MRLNTGFMRFFGLGMVLCATVAQAGSLIVSAQSSGIVAAYDSATGAFQGTIANGLVNPTGLALDPSAANLYITDSGSGIVWKYNTASGTLSQFENLAGSTPFGVTVDNLGNVYVAAENGVISKFSSAGGAALATTTINSGIPRGIAYVANGPEAGSLLLSVSGPDAIDQLTTSLAVSTLSSTGLSNPRYLAVDPTGSILSVVNAGGGLNSGFVENYTIPGMAASTGVGSLQGPNGILYASTTVGYLAEYFGNDVLICSGSCTPLVTGVPGATGIAYSAASLQFGAVPEPAALSLVGLGLIGLGVIRRRRS